MATTETESAITISTPVIVNNDQNGNAISGSNHVAKSTILRIVSLVLWVFTFLLLLIALIVLCTDSITAYDSSNNEEGIIHFEDIYAYRYMLSVTVIGIVYTLVRIGLILINSLIKTSTNDVKAFVLFHFYGDKFISYILATGSAAGFGVTVDMNAEFPWIEEFSSKGFASAALILIAFLCTAVLSVLSSYALTKLAN